MLHWLIIWSPGALQGNSKYSIRIFKKSRGNLKISDIVLPDMENSDQV